MKAKKTIIAVTTIVMIAVVYISFVMAGSPDVNTKVTGEEVYRLNCAGCHREDRSGNAPHYPALTDVKSRLSKDRVLGIITEGENTMPAFSHLSRNEIEAIAAFLFDEKTQSVELSSGTGEGIFKSNCSSCHRATTNDSPPPTSYGCMEPAALAGASKRFSEAEFYNILEEGVCYMPSFAHLTSVEKAFLYDYVKSLEGKGEPLRPTMAEMCPMIMKVRKNQK